MVEFLCGLHQGGFAAPETRVGVVLRHLRPHLLGEAILDPDQILFTLERASHVHRDVA